MYKIRFICRTDGGLGMFRDSDDDPLLQVGGLVSVNDFQFQVQNIEFVLEDLYTMKVYWCLPFMPNNDLMKKYMDEILRRNTSWRVLD